MASSQKATYQTNIARLKHAVKHQSVVKRHHFHVSFFLIGVTIFSIIVVQLAYPSDRGLPLARVSGYSMQWKTDTEITKQITDSFKNTKISLKVDDNTELTVPLSKAGAEPNTEAMVNELTHYPLWQRLIPGTILLQGARVPHADVYFSSKPLNEFSQEAAEKLSSNPQNARLEIKEGKLVATDGISGSSVEADYVGTVIAREQVRLGETTVVNVPSKRIVPKRTAGDLKAVRTEAEAILAHTVAITIEDETYSPDSTERASWVLLDTDENGMITLSIDKAAVNDYLRKLNKKVGTPAGMTDVAITDGIETKRSEGKPGRALDSEPLAKAIVAALSQPERNVQLTGSFRPVAPEIRYNNKYTASETGLRSYVQDVAEQKNMHISVQQLDGEKWTAEARASESIPSASTYKLFVSLVLFHRMQKGEISWNDPMLDTNVSTCFNRMTIDSTNPCAEKWIAMFGRPTINQFIYARGFSPGTSFTTGSANQTTARDLTKFMKGLENGTLVSGAYRERLLHSLSSHLYRDGIPSGSAGHVYDKVGFLWDYVHDTAIVEHPNGTYLLTVMTKGQSYGAIAAVTREIERIMYP